MAGTSMTEHTSTPWEAIGTNEHQTMIVGPPNDRDQSHIVATTQTGVMENKIDVVDAEFIVRACNAFDDMAYRLQCLYFDLGHAPEELATEVDLTATRLGIRECLERAGVGVPTTDPRGGLL